MDKLAALGINETEANRRNKINRGGFTGTFQVQRAAAMGAHTLRIED